MRKKQQTTGKSAQARPEAAAARCARQRIQMVLLREGGITQPEIAAAMGV